MIKVLTGVTSLVAAASIVASASSASAAPKLGVVDGAKMLSATEKSSISGKCACPPPPTCPSTPTPPPPAPAKPGYGFGTTGHYGPPGQGFTASDNWRNHAAGDGLTPSGRPLPPRAFK